MSHSGSSHNFNNNPYQWHNPWDSQDSGGHFEPAYTQNANPVQGPSGYRFGVELELTLRPRYDARHVSELARTFHVSTDIVPLVRSLLQGALKPHRQRVAPAFQSTSYAEWAVENDATILPDPGYFSVEIISPIFHEAEQWPRIFSALWDTLYQFFDVQQNPTCGMHVHFSPAGTQWELHSAKKVAQAAATLDPFIDALLPASRRNSVWSTSNVFAPEVRKRSDDPQRLFAAIERIRSLPELINFISPYKGYAWNFGNLEKRCRTIEFRRPPMATSTADVTKWVHLGLAFIKASQTKEISVTARGRSGRGRIEDFASFLHGCGPTQYTESIFIGVSYQRSMTQEAMETPTDRILKEMKEKKPSFSTAKFEDLLTSNPWK